jgi:propionate CoA-transferase
VLYVTERAVLALTAAGLEVIEVAPGIDLEADVIGRMGFRPVVRDVRPMPAHCFVPATSSMGKEGLEPPSSSQGNTAIPNPGGARL